MTRLPWTLIPECAGQGVSYAAGTDRLELPVHSRAFQQPIRDEAFDHGGAFLGVKRYIVVRGKLKGLAVNVVKSLDRRNGARLVEAKSLSDKGATADIATDDPRHASRKVRNPF